MLDTVFQQPKDKTYKSCIPYAVFYSALKGAFVDVQFTHAVSTNEALYYLKLWLSWSLWIIGLMIVLLSHRKTMILRQRARETNIYVYEVIFKNKIIVSTCFSQIRALEFHVCE